MAKRVFLSLLIHVPIFILLRFLTILVAFVVFGIGASASSDQYDFWINVPALLLQIFAILTIPIWRKKAPSHHRWYVAGVILLLFVTLEYVQV